MSADEYASKELQQWRKAEAKKDIEAIKTHELDMLALGNTFVMKSHKGEQVIEKDDPVSSSTAETDTVLPENQVVVKDTRDDEPADVKLAREVERSAKKKHKKSDRHKDRDRHRERHSSSKSHSHSSSKDKKHSKDKDRDKNKEKSSDSKSHSSDKKHSSKSSSSSSKHSSSSSSKSKSKSSVNEKSSSEVTSSPTKIDSTSSELDDLQARINKATAAIEEAKKQQAANANLVSVPSQKVDDEVEEVSQDMPGSPIDLDLPEVNDMDEIVKKSGIGADEVSSTVTIPTPDQV